MNTLTIYYISDLEDMYDDTNWQQEWFMTQDGFVYADPKVYPPFVNGCKFKVGKTAQSKAELVHKETRFNAYEHYNSDGVQVITIVPNGDVGIELDFESLHEEDEQSYFFNNSEKYIEEWRNK